MLRSCLGKSLCSVKVKFRWQSFCKVTSLYIILNILLPPIASSDPSNDVIQAPSQVERSQNVLFDPPLCYLQTDDGKVLNLQALCGKKPKWQPASVNQSSSTNSGAPSRLTPVSRSSIGASRGYNPDTAIEN